MVDMSVRNHESWEGHKIPGLCTEIEAEFQFCDTPVGLNRSSRVAINGELIMFHAESRSVINRADGFG